jgi:cell division protein ZapA
MSKSNIVRVKIAGQEYVLKTPADPVYIQKVADFVNERMEEVKNQLPENESQLKTSILASMNIVDELLSSRNKQKEFMNKAEAKTLAITEFIDDKINNLKS